jgi:hypothetical protein
MVGLEWLVDTKLKTCERPLFVLCRVSNDQRFLSVEVWELSGSAIS